MKNPVKLGRRVAPARDHARVPRMRARLAVLLVCGLAATALADDDDRRARSFVLGGVTLAYIHHGDDNGGAVGAEASIVFVSSTRGEGALVGNDFRWGGLYADALRDFALDVTRFSIGPELGASLFGADFGFLYQTDGRKGFTVRPVLTAGVVTLFYRFGHYIEGDDDKNFHEFGVIGKLPKKL